MFLRMTTILMMLCLVAATDSGFAADKPEVVERDARGDKNSTGHYLVFCSRDSPGSRLPGHSFIVWAKDDESKQMCSMEAYGFYPEEGKGVFGPVPSEISNETLKKGGDRSCLLIVKVDEKQYQEAEKIRRKWSEQGDFELAKRDCVSFSDAVASSLNLSRPKRSRALLPDTFMRKLAEMNR
jgi:hypothetical protein